MSCIVVTISIRPIPNEPVSSETLGPMMVSLWHGLRMPRTFTVSPLVKDEILEVIHVSFRVDLEEAVFVGGVLALEGIMSIHHLGATADRIKMMYTTELIEEDGQD